MLAVKNQLLLSILMLTAIASKSQPSGSPTSIPKNTEINPLISYSQKWGDAKYSNCNTAIEITYLTKDEKEIIWILNLIRSNPKLAAESILMNRSSAFFVQPSKRNHYFKSLLSTLNSMTPNTNPLFADSSAYVSALCHALTSGKTGYVGHERKRNDCEKDFYGECCDYGNDDPMEIVMSLLLDYDVPSLGHRKICLSSGYTHIGVSIQPHKNYSYNSVLDFK
jgi:hypothetical protein